MRRISIALLVFLMLLIQQNVSFCQEYKDNNKIKTVEGAISALDWPGSTITVRWLNSVGDIGYRELRIKVSSDMEIIKDSDTITPSDLEIGDQVTVEYSKDEDGVLKAKSITVSVQ